MEITADFLDKYNLNPLYRSMGIRIERAAGGEALSRMEPQPEMCWPFPHQPHGGVIFTLMDTTMAWAIFSDLEKGLNCTTIQMDIQYTAPAQGPVFACSARLIHKTQRLAFARARVEDEKGRLVALAQATFRLIRSNVMS